jgi:hypothetical protein
MNVFLIIVVALCLWGTVLWAKPTPRDRQLVRLRQAARQAGLTVKLLDAPLKRHVPALEKLQGDHALYWLYFDFPFTIGDSGLSYARLEGDRIYIDQQDHVPAELIQFITQHQFDRIASLPANQGLLLSNQGIAVIWGEAGEVDAVNKIGEFLTSLKASLDNKK